MLSGLLSENVQFQWCQEGVVDGALRQVLTRIGRMIEGARYMIVLLKSRRAA